MQQLLAYHITLTEKQLDELRRDVKLLAEKIDTLNDFKIRSALTARHVSLIVSAASGFATMLITAAVSYLLQK